MRKRWWEAFDGHYLMMRGLERLGLVWDIRKLDEYEAPAVPRAYPSGQF